MMKYICSITCLLTFASSISTASDMKVYGKGSGYTTRELPYATVVTPDGNTTSYMGASRPVGMERVVVHSGRVDNGTAWGKHIEYRPMSPGKAALDSLKRSKTGTEVFFSLLQLLLSKK
ncbi:MAG: hypothetical protein J6R92_00520 [Akkermansia sp.]|nr:hypothetical protein [Akkermansia sp.]